MAAVAFAGACSDLSPPTEPLAYEQDVSLFGAAPQRGGSAEAFGLDAEFIRIAREHPGFGGMFYGEDGVLNIVSAGVQPMSMRALGSSLRGLGVEPSAERVNVVEGQYDFIQLNAMHRSVSQVLGLQGVVYTDADEARNRVVVGVEDAAAAAAVERAVAMLGLPEGAVIIERTDPVFPEQTLRDRVRPIGGGLQIWRFIPPGSGSICTLGFNVSSVGGGARGFVTNSHCTEVQGVVTGTMWSQKAFALPVEPVAVEEHDAPFFTGGICPVGQQCRWSDAAGARYEPGVENVLGRIYRTTGVNTGSLDIDPANPFFTITAERAFPNVGDVVHKVGRTTGWTSGTVAQTCAHTGVSGTTITMLCQDFVVGVNYSASGDSGSPVFRRIGDTGAELNGIHWGGSGDGTVGVFSAMQNIRCENQGPAPWITYPGQTPPAPTACPGR